MGGLSTPELEGSALLCQWVSRPRFRRPGAPTPRALPLPWGLVVEALQQFYGRLFRQLGCTIPRATCMHLERRLCCSQMPRTNAAPFAPARAVSFGRTSAKVVRSCKLIALPSCHWTLRAKVCRSSSQRPASGCDTTSSRRLAPRLQWALPTPVSLRGVVVQAAAPDPDGSSRARPPSQASAASRCSGWPAPVPEATQACGWCACSSRMALASPSRRGPQQAAGWARWGTATRSGPWMREARHS
mmetsp:Transcript_2086/g.8137  ORF Transcript_2086/g.8137 Transcript_2086/m.8137 type:complete len:244 (-) Transcript_2086:390-1121(-)